MNERIRELAEQAAWKTRMAHNNAYWRMSEELPEDITWREKFAEMIVRECALTLESITVPVSQCYEDFDNGYNKALLTGSTVIKQHFGVE